jgi:hypothetical protein
VQSHRPPSGIAAGAEVSEEVIKRVIEVIKQVIG